MIPESDGVRSQGLKMTPKLGAQFWSNKNWIFRQLGSWGIKFDGLWLHDSGVRWSQESRFKMSPESRAGVGVKFRHDSGIKAKVESVFSLTPDTCGFLLLGFVIRSNFRNCLFVKFLEANTAIRMEKRGHQAIISPLPILHIYANVITYNSITSVASYGYLTGNVVFW